MWEGRDGGPQGQGGLEWQGTVAREGEGRLLSRGPTSHQLSGARVWMTAWGPPGTHANARPETETDSALVVPAAAPTLIRMPEGTNGDEVASARAPEG